MEWIGSATNSSKRLHDRGQLVDMQTGNSYWALPDARSAIANPAVPFDRVGQRRRKRPR